MRPSCFGYAVFLSPDFVRPSTEACAEEARIMVGTNDSGSVSPFFPDAEFFQGLSSSECGFAGLVAARSARHDYL